ncbi:MAG: hypothetical protein UY63_C0004G0009 [Parcubacteria group bacterium GW2011_GWA2_51_10]|nr:MAG: hypothetical protein UY63_C0004G0009 [Parcubacteria group bacterium GW2011_GWA2_51_10]
MEATNPNVRALLFSSHKVHGREYLDHAEGAIKAFLGPVTKVVFIPFALNDWDRYTWENRKRFAAMDIDLIGIQEVQGNIHDELDKLYLGRDSLAIVVGGGNTFRLLKDMQSGLIDQMRFYLTVRGVRYIGVSAGTNVVCPTIMTTNDMPIVMPWSFDALGLIPYQINTHYVDAAIADGHMGETREERIREFHEENDVPVIGLREASWILVEQGISTLGGPSAARLFLPGHAAEFEGTRSIESEIAYAQSLQR